jgi:hypothetical protein
LTNQDKESVVFVDTFLISNARNEVVGYLLSECIAVMVNVEKMNEDDLLFKKMGLKSER